MNANPGLSSLTPVQLENMALVLYGPFRFCRAQHAVLDSAGRSQWHSYLGRQHGQQPAGSGLRRQLPVQGSVSESFTMKIIARIVFVSMLAASATPALS